MFLWPMCERCFMHGWHRFVCVRVLGGLQWNTMRLDCRHFSQQQLSNSCCFNQQHSSCRCLNEHHSNCCCFGQQHSNCFCCRCLGQQHSNCPYFSQQHSKYEQHSLGQQ